ncbi:hypothetical protein [Companilactobacillus sp. HBUAS59699]|uniref:hypothetical protein n=1 Tax=Companilactobacillus sp. HBUAS59699 TaxID=3109358 RepID=UPI002FEF7AC2
MKKITRSRGTSIVLLGLLYLGLTLFMLLTIKRSFVWNGDDIYYQFQRMQNIIYSIRDAHTIPTISINNFGLIGYGINIFYPWVTLLPFAMISFLITDPVTIYYAGLAFFFFISFLISHYSMKSFSHSTKQAIIFAVVYNFSTYRLKGESITALVTASFQNTSYRAIEGNVYNIGTILLLTLVIGLLFYKQFEKKYRIIYWISIVSFLLATNTFPWSLLQHTPIHAIQFPFRILMFTTLFTSVIAAKVIELSVQNYSFKIWWIVAGMFVVINCSLWSLSFNKSIDQTLLSRDDLVITNEMINKGEIPDSYLEQYIPKKSQQSIAQIEQHVAIVDGKKLTMKPAITPEGNQYQFENIKSQTVIDLPVAYYRGTILKINGEKVPASRSSRGGLRWQADHAYTNVTLTTNYANRTVYLSVAVISLLAWIYLVIPNDVYKSKKN